MYYFTADHHFGHENIIEICKRPFKSATKMDNALIKNHNSIVTNEDTVFFLGDFSLKSAQHAGYYRSILDKLNGKKHLILGNHDVENVWFHIRNGFLSVHTHFVLSLTDGEAFIMGHDPVEALVFPDSLYLCGHVHTLFKKMKNIVNVGVDVWDYKPISWEEIKEINE